MVIASVKKTVFVRGFAFRGQELWLQALPGCYARLFASDIRGIQKYEDLPENCRKYIEFIEKHIGFPITMVSNGPGREDIIYR